MSVLMLSLDSGAAEPMFFLEQDKAHRYGEIEFAPPDVC
jgi:hypothetical protein